MSHTFQTLLKSCNAEQSLSPSGSPQHNAVIEIFLCFDKKEELYGRDNCAIDDIKSCIDKYIEFYNDRRPHGSFNYRTPSAHKNLFFSCELRTSN